MRASHGLGIAAIVIALFSPSAASAEPEGASKGAVAQPAPVPEPNVRVGLVYAPTILVSDASRSGAIDDPLHGVSTGAHHLGVELALGSGYFRYHLTVAFSAATGATGLRVTAYVAPGGRVISAGASTPDAEAAATAVDCVVDAVRGLTMPDPGSYAAKVTFLVQ